MFYNAGLIVQAPVCMSISVVHGYGAGTASPTTNGGYFGLSDAEVGAGTVGPCGKITWKLFLKPLPAPEFAISRARALGYHHRYAYGCVYN